MKTKNRKGYRVRVWCIDDPKPTRMRDFTCTRGELRTFADGVRLGHSVDLEIQRSDVWKTDIVVLKGQRQFILVERNNG